MDRFAVRVRSMNFVLSGELMISKYVNPSRRVFALFLLLFVSLLLFPNIVKAKRAGPPEVKPVQLGEYEYRVPNDPDSVGVVEIWDKAGKKRVGKICVYEVKYKLFVERDTQWVFITKIEVKEGLLLVANEKGESFKIDPQTKRVTKIE